jgi:hypothetical protein
MWLEAQGKPTAQTAAARRANELTVGALRPGKDGVGKAFRLYGRAKNGKRGDTEFSWAAWCRNESLYVTTDAAGMIEEVRTEWQRDTVWLDCAESKPKDPWWTSKHLAVGDPASKVISLYGEPASRSPSTKDGRQLELLYYAFDWAGPDVPQILTVLCTLQEDDNPGRVLEITLDAESL